jgi:hypothetical protein
MRRNFSTSATALHGAKQLLSMFREAGPCATTSFTIRRACYFDDSNPDILSELTETVRKTLSHERHVHLILENGKPPRLYNAQWNDDYSGRSEAGLVMASTGKVDTGTRAPLSATLMGYKESK